ncbi:MAG: hypothetical protein IKY44_01510, partial [Clostridia bacterium]|nr:hypothetical protein [Clostridia bacterium]
FNRVKIAKADSPSTALAVGTAYVDNGDGTFTWTVKLADPGAATEYIFDARRSSDSKYTKNYFNFTYTPIVKDYAVKSVEHVVENGTAYYTVVTAAGYDRVKIALASAPSTALAVGTKGVTNPDGTITWTVKYAAPTTETEYIFDARDAETLKFTKEYFDYTFIPSTEPEKAVKSVTVTEDDGTLYFSVVTGAGYNRVKIAPASAPSTSLAIGSVGVDNGDGTLTWTVKLADPKAETVYAFDARITETGKYTKDYFEFTYTPTVAPEKAVRSVESYIEAGYLCFTVTTGAEYNRVKAALASAPSTSLAVSDKPTANPDGTLTWTVKVADPGKAETYVFDARITETLKYTKDYFEYAYTPSEEVAPFQSITTEFIGDKVVFTIITDDIFNRVKIATPDNPNGYVKYTDTFTDLGNGTHQWVITFAAPTTETQYLLDGRYTATNRYAKENFAYTLVIEDTAIIKSVDFSEVDGKAVFTVVTSNKLNRVKVAFADNAAGNIKYTNDFVTLANGDRQWVIKIDMPEETTEYAIDGRLISTGKYSKEYYNYTVTVEAPIVSPFISASTTSGAFYANIIVTTTDGCSSIVVDGISYSTYTVNEQGNRVFVCSIAAPGVTTVYSVQMLDQNGRVLDTQPVTCYAGGFDHEIVS